MPNQITEVAIDGVKFLINGKPTYEGVSYRGKPIEGLLFNSRMIQAIFDDACPQTRDRWRYPDTGVWDPERNTREFCERLAEYRSYGLLGVTVGLQGGGSIYTPDVYDHYDNSAFAPDGSLKKPYFDRLERVLEAADDAGIVVIVNYFYWKHVQRIVDDNAIYEITEKTTDWLLRTGRRNILVDIGNETGNWWKRPALGPDNIHRVIETAKGVTLNGRRLLISSSSGGLDQIATGSWLEAEDFSLPHGNGCNPDSLRDKLRRWRDTPEFRKRPRPVLINEDSVFLDNLEASVDEYASWGFYCQGYGSGYPERVNWAEHGREDKHESLSGFQTLPVNWSPINDPFKKAFFERIKTITSGQF